ncbi:hypothetical protein RFI_23203 [Reticulomyxa filosa]|uniref:Uncharacterized protein n=1 Tax=Reticulomyxa filosa TaxID=46433 RepID=X6MJW8_RETFI|nr:hypothetical protein RFI_23203 [Reticulomyxa filosa]|eukprot:ETO14164.1 hypothetical protein RFI_23203 [Reticulomyxa filosa]
MYGQIRNEKTFGSKALLPDDLKELLRNKIWNPKQLAKKKHGIIKVIDIMDFQGSFISNFRSMYARQGTPNSSNFNSNAQRRVPLVIALNKCDLLIANARKQISNQMIADWAMHECLRYGVKPDAIVCISAKKGENCKQLLETMMRLLPIETSDRVMSYSYERYREIYVIGKASVGKSTLLNHLQQLNLISSGRERKLTTSLLPGTTLNVIPFTVQGYGRTRLFDTPGVIQDSDNCLIQKFTVEELKMVSHKKEVKPVTYRIGKGQSMIIGSLIELRIMDGSNYFVTLFAAPQVTCHICKWTKTQSQKDVADASADDNDNGNVAMSQVNQLLLKHGGRLFRPVAERSRVREFWPLEFKKEWTFDGLGWQYPVCDIVFPGIGWVSLAGSKSITVQVHGPANYKVGVRKPLLPHGFKKNVRTLHTSLIFFKAMKKYKKRPAILRKIFFAYNEIIRISKICYYEIISFKTILSSFLHFTLKNCSKNGSTYFEQENFKKQKDTYWESRH